MQILTWQPRAFAQTEHHSPATETETLSHVPNEIWKPASFLLPFVPCRALSKAKVLGIVLSLCATTEGVSLQERATLVTPVTTPSVLCSPWLQPCYSSHSGDEYTCQNNKWLSQDLMGKQEKNAQSWFQTQTRIFALFIQQFSQTVNQGEK